MSKVDQRRGRGGGQCLAPDDVASAVLARGLVLVDGEADVRRQPNARGGDVQLAVREARLAEVDADAPERLAASAAEPGAAAARLERAGGLRVAGLLGKEERAAVRASPRADEKGADLDAPDARAIAYISAGEAAEAPIIAGISVLLLPS